MNPKSKMGLVDDDSNNNNDSIKTKPIATASLMGGIIIVATALLSGLLSLIGSGYYQIAAAQQNITADNAITANTSRTAGNSGQSSSACAPTETGQANGATTGINATSITSGGAASVAEANQSTMSQAIMHIEQACIAAQNNDTQGVLMNLTFALNALGVGGSTEGNNTIASTTADGDDATTSQDRISVDRTSSADDSDETENDNDDAAADDNSDESNTSSPDENSRETDTDDEDSECGGVTVGGTSAADDYGCPPDPDY